MKNTFLLIIVIIFTSCYQESKPKKPDNLISKDKMVAVIIDVSLFNSAKGSNRKKLENNGFTTKNNIYKKHQIDSAQFAASSNYYAYYTDDYKAIYTKVVDSMKQLQDKYKAQQKKENKKKKQAQKVKKQKRDTTKVKLPDIKKRSLINRDKK